MKRAVSILLVFLLALGIFAGCSSKEPDATKETQKATGEETQISKEPLSFKVMTVNFGEVPTGKLANDAWLAEMEKLMGRKLDITFEYVSAADYGEKLKIMLTSMQLPDIFTSWGINQKEVFDYGANGTFVELTSKMDKMPLYKKYLDSAPDSLNNLYSADGKLYGFYSVQAGWQNYSGGSNEIAYSTAIRKDIFDNNGIAVPATIDDLYAAAKKLKEIYPDKYPIMQAAEWMPPMDILATANHFTCTFKYKEFDGRFYDGSKFVYSPLTEAYKEAMMEMNKWYKEKLISPDFFTQTTANGDGTVAAGEAMIIPSVWYGSPAEWNKKYPDQYWILIPGLENPKYGKPWVYNKGSSDDVRILPNWAVLVNAESRNVDELLRFMDYQMSDTVSTILNWGVEGNTYTVADGAKQFSDAIKADIDGLNKAGVGTGSCRSGIFPQIQDMNAGLASQKAQGLLQDFIYKGQTTNNTVPGYIKDNYNDEQALPFSRIILDPLTTDEAEEYANIMTPINTYASEQMAAFIIGSRSFDKWDAYVKELNAMGDIQKAMDIYNSKIKGKKK